MQFILPTQKQHFQLTLTDLYIFTDTSLRNNFHLLLLKKEDNQYGYTYECMKKCVFLNVVH